MAPACMALEGQLLAHLPMLLCVRLQGMSSSRRRRKSAGGLDWVAATLDYKPKLPECRRHHFERKP